MLRGRLSSSVCNHLGRYAAAMMPDNYMRQLACIRMVKFLTQAETGFEMDNRVRDGLRQVARVQEHDTARQLHGPSGGHMQQFSQ